MDEFTLGVEEEYQLVDPQTGELRSRAQDVLETDWSEEIEAEVQETMIEIGTRVCSSTAELKEEIGRLRFQAACAAEAEGLRIAAAALHPFSSWRGQQLAGGDRYQRLAEHYGRILRTEHLFGMHVHVAIPERLDRARLMCHLRAYTPHLLALSASSPLLEGEDTGFASYRTILWSRLPHTGPPPAFDSEAEYQRHVDHLVRTSSSLDAGTIYWTLRPHATYPTLEFRVSDVTPSLPDAVAIAALARTLVVAAAEGRLREPAGTVPQDALLGLLAANEWQAARYGLDAVLANPEGETGLRVRDEIRKLLDRLHPVAEAMGDDEALAQVETILQRGNAASRIREIRSDCTLPALVEWLCDESVLGTGLDRRHIQREECA